MYQPEQAEREGAECTAVEAANTSLAAEPETASSLFSRALCMV